MFCARLFICASWSPAGKGLTSWLSFVVSSVSLSLSHWYPGSGVVLDCIDSWSLQPYLLCIPENGRVGGIILDEMSIQQDIQINKSGEVVEIVGFEDIGSEGNACNTLRKVKQEKELGTHVLQFVFLGITGFRFPFAHFVTTNIQAYDIYSLFWEAVDYLYMFGFTAIYACTDGAQSNRSFIYINLGKDPLTTISTSPCNPNKSVIFMMDISHVIKKIRNNVLKSGVAKFSTRNLTLPDKSILQWEMWVNAYKWDQQNALQLHRKLTNEHIFLTQQGKMRNHLAKEVLNSEMLNLMLEYKASLANQGDILNGELEFLKKTSKMIEVFHSTRPICTKDDERLKELAEINIWFSDWTRRVQAQSVKMQTNLNSWCLTSVWRTSILVCRVFLTFALWSCQAGKMHI